MPCAKRPACVGGQPPLHSVLAQPPNRPMMPPACGHNAD